MAQADHLPSPIHDSFPDASATNPTSRGQPAAHENKKGVRTSAPTAEARPGHRRHFIGGSDARIIMGDDEASLLRLWREKRGEIEPEDFSDNLPVQLGVVTEALNRSWYERNTGRVVTDVQRWVRHPVHRFFAATLDGFVNDVDAVFEAKFMLPWSFSEEAAAEKKFWR